MSKLKNSNTTIVLARCPNVLTACVRVNWCPRKARCSSPAPGPAQIRDTGARLLLVTFCPPAQAAAEPGACFKQNTIAVITSVILGRYVPSIRV